MTQQQTLADRWQWMSEILADAMQLNDRGAREALVRERCDGDAEAERELLSLLAADTLFVPSLDESAIASAARAALSGDADESHADWRGKRVGAYEIVDTIAVGGMGAVFKAKRVDETYETLVAIKVMREDLSAKAKQNVLSRFRAERQMLATLNHPNITRLLDGGSTPDGLPYFVMEYVDGEPIDRYCEAKSLPMLARLAKFRDVLSAVHFAHQRLIVHRDLKPSNILVDRNGVVKLLDFGIARLLDPEATATRGEGASAATTTLLAMTPAYASPEQVKSEAITTASDVYSLGVVLYRLLTGVSPYKSKTTQPMDLAREIAETDPERPSTAVVTATNSEPPGAPARSIDVARLKKMLRGDLDNIVLMALRKDPARRYASAEQFSEDIGRYLTHEPVLAHADSLAYRANKFVHRNRWSVGFAAFAVIGLIGGIVATSYQANVARAAQAKAEIERARAERLFGNVRDLSNRFVTEVFEQIQPVAGTSAAQQTVIATAAEYLDKLASEANENRQLLLEAAQGHVILAQLQERAQLPKEKRTATLRRAIALVERAEQLSARDTSSLTMLLHLESILGELETAHERYDVALARFERLLPAALAASGDDFALLRAKGDFLIAFGASAIALGQPLSRAIKLFDQAQLSYRAAASSATKDADRFTARTLEVLTTLQAGRAEAELPAGAGLKNATSRVEAGYAKLLDLLRKRAGDAALITNAAYAAALLADYTAKLGDYPRSREYFRIALKHDDQRASDSGLVLGDVNSLTLRLSQLEVEILADATPRELAELLSGIDQRVQKFPKASVEPLVVNAIAAWREGLAGEVFLRQGSETTRPRSERSTLIEQSIAAFARCDELLQKIPKSYIDQNRPEIIRLIETGSTRSREARAQLRKR
jgi:serine/threonine protein kinase/tetratricopeptide (TPR) repeat protein